MTYTKQGPFTTGGPGTAANLTAMDNGIAAALPLDGSAPMTGPIKLATGHQETGVIGWSGYQVAGHNVSILKNFRMRMVNIPTSITTTNLSTPTNASGLSFNLITLDGLNMFWTAVSTGDTGWNVQYTTVGNCLLAVDTVAATFDHHCDPCGHVHRAIPIADLQMARGLAPQLHALSYACPDCGAIEHLTCSFTQSDEADATPQGAGEYATTRGAQAAMIRQLLRLLGLPLAD